MEITNTFVSILGLFLAHHMSSRAISYKTSSDRTVHVQFLLLCCLILMNRLMFARESVVFFPIIISCVLFFPTITVTIYARRAFWWRKNQIRLLKKIKMKVRSGSSLKQSMSDSMLDEPDWLSNSAQNNPSWQKMSSTECILNREVHIFFSELNLLMASNSRILERLESLIQTKKVAQKLGQKSSAALAQARAQAGAAALIYFSVLIWRTLFSSEKASPGMTLTSLVLFFLGSLLLIIVGKGFKWKT